MKMKHIAIASFLLAATPAQADISVTLDVGFAEAVLNDVCSGNTVDEATLRNSAPVQNMLSHFSQFRDYFTMEAYLNSRQDAANCIKVDRDIFRFNEVIDNKQALLAEIAVMKAAQQDYSQNISAMLAPFVPEGVSYHGRATIAIGIPSCGGWSKGQDFYIDLPCITNDQQGLQYLIAHETYHGMQDQFFPNPEKADYLSRLFSAVAREGSATTIADFSLIEDGGSYTAKSKRSIQKNASRQQQNFDLLDMSIGYIQRTLTADAYSVVNNIGLSGNYDAPFYAVGAAVFKVVDKVEGRETLMCLLQQSPFALFKRYAALAAQDEAMPQFGASTFLALESADAGSLDECKVN